MKNNSNTYLYDIAAIILAYLRNEIDEEGQQKLNAWLKESDSHEALFVRILDENELNNETVHIGSTVRVKN